ncbi:hypothetical protein [Pseudolabrys sp. FHR47]|uniref:hypothetical protein n=1 Tax=Pseudolabrys sp. FHR47 TaxID=2562284 RepID=UPI0010BF4BFF|nr:hypothetical protein [Pseudolabrys sp. FHR47]
MSDPRLNDPRFDTRPTDPTLRNAEFRRAGSSSTSSTWAWVGGIAAVILIAILVMGNWHTGTDTGTPVTANNPAATAPAGSPPARNVTPPSTTGSGATSPAPSQPAPQNNQ